MKREKEEDSAKEEKEREAHIKVGKTLCQSVSAKRDTCKSDRIQYKKYSIEEYSKYIT